MKSRYNKTFVELERREREKDKAAVFNFCALAKEKLSTFVSWISSLEEEDGDDDDNTKEITSTITTTTATATTTALAVATTATTTTTIITTTTTPPTATTTPGYKDKDHNDGYNKGCVYVAKLFCLITSRNGEKEDSTSVTRCFERKKWPNFCKNGQKWWLFRQLSTKSEGQDALKTYPTWAKKSPHVYNNGPKVCQICGLFWPLTKLPNFGQK